MKEQFSIPSEGMWPRVRASEPWAATACGLPHSLSKHYIDLLPFPLSLGTLDSKGLWSLFAEGKPLNQEADPKGRHVLTSLKKGQGPTSLSRAEQ